MACRGVYPFAPNGEQTARKALERAIERAKHYIYIEEQFLWPCSVVDSLRKVVKRNPALKVVIVLAEELEFEGPLRNVHHEMRNEAISAVIGISTGQVFVYCLEQPSTKTPIYVHSKLTVIDDCFVAIGSVNVNKRSLTTDAELHMGIVDADVIRSTMNGIPVSVCRFAKELRVALWAEHLGITDMTKLEDPAAALSLWPDWSKSTPRAPSRVHHALCYHPRSETATLLEWLEIMRALRAVFPKLPPPWDKFIDLDKAIDLAESLESTVKDKIGVSPPDILLGPYFFGLKRLLRDFVMNIETTC
ncbi:MAG TPA: phospholipase D-like domain-containing protein [Nitrospiraceae bacterium]|nr:phospholipase D-like domain-containing protein [Nitrospiraceae bacterium]